LLLLLLLLLLWVVVVVIVIVIVIVGIAVLFVVLGLTVHVLLGLLSPHRAHCLARCLQMTKVLADAVVLTQDTAAKLLSFAIDVAAVHPIPASGPLVDPHVRMTVGRCICDGKQHWQAAVYVTNFSPSFRSHLFCLGWLWMARAGRLVCRLVGLLVG
jgi:hypothetical protein